MSSKAKTLDDLVAGLMGLSFDYDQALAAAQRYGTLEACYEFLLQNPDAKPLDPAVLDSLDAVVSPAKPPPTPANAGNRRSLSSISNSSGSGSRRSPSPSDRKKPERKADYEADAAFASSDDADDKEYQRMIDEYETAAAIRREQEAASLKTIKALQEEDEKRRAQQAADDAASQELIRRLTSNDVAIEASQDLVRELEFDGKKGSNGECEHGKACKLTSDRHKWLFKHTNASKRFIKGECPEDPCANFDELHRWEFKHFCQNELADGCFIDASQDAEHCAAFFHHKREFWGRLPGNKGDCKGGTSQTCPQREDPAHVWDFTHAKASPKTSPKQRAAAAAIARANSNSNNGGKANSSANEEPLSGARVRDPDAPDTSEELARIVAYLRGDIPKSPAGSAVVADADDAENSDEEKADNKAGDRLANVNGASRNRSPSPKACTHGASCRKLLLDAEHGKEFQHADTLFKELTNSKHELKNAIRDWWLSPNLRVAIQDGKFAGRFGYLQGACLLDRTRKQREHPDDLLVSVKNDDDEIEFVRVARDKLTPARREPKDLNAPWFHDRVRVFRVPASANFKRETLSKPVPGLLDKDNKEVSYIAVVEMMHRNGVPCFILGGTPRDLVQHGDKCAIKDLDLAIGCSVHKLNELVKREGWSPAVTGRDSGLFLIGKKSGLFLEGKPMALANCDMFSTSDAIWPSMGCDIFAENIYGDFCCNRLWYDPINDTVCDPTGFGVHDSLERIIRIPVEAKDWPTWVKGNPTKLLRVFKFLAKGYRTPADDDGKTLKFVKEQFDEYFVKRDLQYQLDWWMNFQIDAKAATDFRALVVQQLGQEKWDRCFKKKFALMFPAL